MDLTPFLQYGELTYKFIGVEGRPIHPSLLPLLQETVDLLRTMPSLADDWGEGTLGFDDETDTDSDSDFDTETDSDLDTELDTDLESEFDTEFDFDTDSLSETDETASILPSA